MIGAAVRKPRVPNDKLHRVTDNRLAEADRKVLHGVCLCAFTFTGYWCQQEENLAKKLLAYTRKFPLCTWGNEDCTRVKRSLFVAIVLP